MYVGSEQEAFHYGAYIAALCGVQCYNEQGTSCSRSIHVIT